MAETFTRVAAARLQRRYPDWAEAMINEHASLADSDDQLSWAWGALRASFEVSGPAQGLYPALLGLSIAAMTLYQWSADENLDTLIILSLLGFGLGFLRPQRFMLSGVAVGIVVAAVNSFETLSGIRPAYEVFTHSLAHNLCWLALVVPGLCASALGRQVGLRLAT